MFSPGHSLAGFRQENLRRLIKSQEGASVRAQGMLQVKRTLDCLNLSSFNDQPNTATFCLAANE